MENQNDMFNALISSKNKGHFSSTLYKLKNKFPLKEQKKVINKIALEAWMRWKHDYCVFKGNTTELLTILKGVKTSFDPFNPVTD